MVLLTVVGGIIVSLIFAFGLYKLLEYLDKPKE